MFKTSKSIKIYILQYSIVNQWRSRAIEVVTRILELEYCGKVQTTFVLKIDYVISIKTSKHIKRVYLQSIQKSLCKYQVVGCDDVHFEQKLTRFSSKLGQTTSDVKHTMLFHPE